MVGHYAAGARLIGLTEKQLAKHLTLLTSNTATSPYLQPVCPIITGGGAEDKKRMKKKARVLEKPQEVPPLIEVHVPPSEKTTSVIKFVLKVYVDHNVFRINVPCLMRNTRCKDLTTQQAFSHSYTQHLCP